MKLFKKLNSRKVPIVVLSILLICLSGITVSAATTDDLREIIGDKRVTDETLEKELKTIIYRHRQSEYRKELIDILETKGDFGYEEKFMKLMEKKDKSLKTLEKNFCSNADVKVIIIDLNDSISVLDELGALNRSDNYVIDELDVKNDEDAYNYALSVLEAVDDTFDIGSIGEGLKFPTKGNSKLYRAFGKNAIVTSEVRIEDNNGIDLYVTSRPDENFKAEIVSQFNGKVTAIKKTKKGYRITINHGKSLVTIYEYLESIKVNKGDTVDQYQVIGYIADDTLHFETILNTVHINPLFMYGDMGEQLYEEWHGANPGMAVEKVDFSKVKKYIENNAVGNIGETIPSFVTEGDIETQINYEEGYIKPIVPIVEYIEEGK